MCEEEFFILYISFFLNYFVSFFISENKKLSSPPISVFKLFQIPVILLIHSLELQKNPQKQQIMLIIGKQPMNALLI